MVGDWCLTWTTPTASSSRQNPAQLPPSRSLRLRVAAPRGSPPKDPRSKFTTSTSITRREGVAPHGGGVVLEPLVQLPSGIVSRGRDSCLHNANYSSNRYLLAAFVEMLMAERWGGRLWVRRPAVGESLRHDLAPSGSSAMELHRTWELDLIRACLCISDMCSL